MFNLCGTDDGRVLKVINLQFIEGGKAVVISDTQVFEKGVAVRGINITSQPGKVVVVASNAVKLVNLTNCGLVSRCV